MKNKKTQKESMKKSFFQKKSLGQNFLNSPGALNKILSSAQIKKGESVLEVGPGKGVLTEKLLSMGAKVFAVEKDRRLIPILEEKFKKEISSHTLKIIEGDILKINLEEIGIEKNKYKITANIPYYITGKFIRKFLEEKNQPEKIVIMVQKEVAQRILAEDGKESLLSISIKAYGTPSYITTVKRGSFYPAPNVDSAIISIDQISRENFIDFNEETLFLVLKKGFSKKRGQLLSNLSSLLPKNTLLEVFEKADIPPLSRAENLSIENWKSIAQYIAKNTKSM